MNRIIFLLLFAGPLNLYAEEIGSVDTVFKFLGSNHKIIIEASEQSNRLKVPKLEKILKLNEFLKLNQNTNIIFGDLNTDNSKFNFKSSDQICILIGPEGDFTVKERENILKLKKLIPLKINQNILRSETAAISMISIISFNLLP